MDHVNSRHAASSSYVHVGWDVHRKSCADAVANRIYYWKDSAVVAGHPHENYYICEQKYITNARR